MLHWTKAILKGGHRILFGYFFWMRRYGNPKNKDKIPLEKRYAKVRKIAYKTCKALQGEFHVEGLENLPEGALAFFPNHDSAFDPVIILSILERNTTFVSKIEIAKIPAVKECINAIEGDFIDRKDLKQSLKVMMRIEKSLKEGNKSWVIFPEGTRNKDNMANCLPFHHGTFRPAFKSETPIVPVAIFGTNSILLTKPQYKKYHCFIKFLPPIYPEQYKDMTTEEIAVMVQERIDKVISFDLRRKSHAIMLKEKNYRFNYLK